MRDKVFSKKEFIKAVTENVKTMYRKTLKEASQQEIFQAVSLAVKDIIMDEWMATQQVIEHDDPKTVYYMSMEFLMGRALGNNLINLCAYKEVWAVWQPALWIRLQHLVMQHMDVVSAIVMVCSSSRLLMDSR